MIIKSLGNTKFSLILFSMNSFWTCGVKRCIILKWVCSPMCLFCMYKNVFKNCIFISVFHNFPLFPLSMTKKKKSLCNFNLQQSSLHIMCQRVALIQSALILRKYNTKSSEQFLTLVHKDESVWHENWVLELFLRTYDGST